MGSSQHQLPSLEQLASLNKEQRKTLHCAFAATSHLETGMMTWNGSQSLHPYVIYNRNLLDAFAITNRVRWYFGKMGASVGSYMNESTKKNPRVLKKRVRVTLTILKLISSSCLFLHRLFFLHAFICLSA